MNDRVCGKREGMVRKSIVFAGSVQGVGFRWRARHAANLYGCTGWCRNERDGSVTMEIQGEEERIGLVISALEQGRFIQIERMDVKDLPLKDERGFAAE